MREIECESCGARLRAAEDLRATTCPYCASPSVIERPPTRDRPDPAFVVAFVLDRERARAAVTRWIGSRGFFTRSDFKRADPELTRGVYLPAWLYGAEARSDFSADIGENYTVTETYTTTVNGKTVTRTRTRVKTEWRHLDGDHATWLTDVVVTASRGIPNSELEAIEPFDLRALRRYDASLISGWTAEEPSRTREECRVLAHDESIQLVGDRLENFMPGDSYRDIRYDTWLENEVIDLLLLPVWSYVVRYSENEDPIRILVNGQTGRVAGRVPVSGTRIATIIGLGVLALVVVVFLLTRGAR